MREELTEKQKKMIKLFTENIGSSKKTKTLKAMMLEAGYSESSANQQTSLLSPIRDRMKTVVDKLEKEREEILKEMVNKRKKANYSDLVKGLDITTKNIQLLGGKPTEIQPVLVKFLHEKSN